MGLKHKKSKKTHHKNLKIIKKYWARIVRVKLNNKKQNRKKIIKLVLVKVQFKLKKLVRGIKRKTRIKQKEISKINNKYQVSNFNMKIINKNKQKMLKKMMKMNKILIYKMIYKIKYIILNKIWITQVRKMNIHQDQFLRMNKIKKII